MTDSESYTFFGGNNEHVDPSKFSLDELSRIKCSIWTARCNIPYGPRPNQDDNILAMDFIDLYDFPTQQRMMYDYKSRGYNSCAQGPFNGQGYHGQYPDIDYTNHFDDWLDVQQMLWDNQIKPIVFIHPDGWELNQMDVYDRLLSSARAQRLIRIVVYTGWEPAKYEWTNEYWVRWLVKQKQLFPNALHLVHTVADVDALTGGEDYRIPGFTNATAWVNTVPYLHGWLIQIGGYLGAATPSADAFKNSMQDYVRDLHRRFHNGYAGWPTNSEWGNKPLKLYMFEYAAYNDYWLNWPEDEARKLGQYAMEAGADGYGDGGF